MTYRRITLEALDRAQLRIGCAKANLTVIGIGLSDGSEPSGVILNCALDAVCELLETVNDILNSSEACHG